MIPDKITKGYNTQINEELYSAYLYLAMAAYFEDMSLSGFAAWMYSQWQEEINHAMRLMNHLIERGARVRLDAIDQPPSQWNSPLDAFSAALDHERKVTAMINELMLLSRDEKDPASESFLTWFVDEQVEEEDSVGTVVDQLKLVGENSYGLFMIDKDLSTRVAPAPSLTPPEASGSA